MRARLWGVVIAAVGAIGVAVWVAWLRGRREHWRGVLSDAIPVNSTYWRDLGSKPGEILYAAIGDSAAQGIGASRPAHSYVGFIARHLRSRTTRTVRVANLSVSGGTVRTAIDTELPLLAALGHEPDVITVSIGANDIASWDPERFDRDIRELFAALPSHAIVADLPSFYFLPGERKVLVANRLLRAAAADVGLEVVDLHAITNRQGLWGVSTQFAGDLFHPNDRGYALWARAFTAAVDRRMDLVLGERD
ncbi:SGNH/GDSL hydrolase family protein [Leifsonia sp. Leaf264]|uniref:SGNH/GDSL hydrolase family protein n=1 Tax=Leifsonia sp. Leaf264 TaxID=1736314 RepID=UPI0009EA5F71|nr:SGNH/GDSL hydrolase family protein [Leifsonia sp. Leaf264]